MDPRDPRPSSSIDPRVTGSDDESLAASKRRLRGEMERLRRSVTPREASRASAVAVGALMGLECVANAARIAMYAALPDEMPTRALFDAVVSLGRPVLFPRTQTNRPLEFSVVDRWEELCVGTYGVLEPQGSRRIETFGTRDLVVVPGVAFDDSGNRLGRGKAYYDRTFPPDSATSPVLIGYGYEFQVVDHVPHAAHDRRLDAIVTEHTVRHCR